MFARWLPRKRGLTELIHLSYCAAKDPYGAEESQGSSSAQRGPSGTACPQDDADQFNSSIAAQVFGPTMPSGTIPRARCRSRIAASVFGPNSPVCSTLSFL